MHDVVIEELERHLSGSASRSFYAHLEHCSPCRESVAEMENVSGLLRELRPNPLSSVHPPLGFYHRVGGAIVDHQQKEAWGLFSPGRAFFRRVAFASLLLLAGLGSFLVSRESSFAVDAANDGDAAAIIAQHDATVMHPEGADRDHMLVTLATYHE